tara:strand:- start:31781 stop:33094 length:1314 start_codon:yes stop_codon:yes gene_type:complete
MKEMGTIKPLEKGIGNRGFISLLLTMACGALNDNLYRGTLMLLVVSGSAWGGSLGSGGTGWVTLMVYVPFLLLLGFTGLLSDRYSKRRIIVLTRFVEIILACFVVLAMWMDSPWFAFVILILLASQSAFFSPAKYGSVPEVVSSGNLSRANGLLSLLTNACIVAGLSLSGILLDYGADVGISGTVFVGIVMVVIATFSFLITFMIPRAPAARPDLKMSFNGFKTYWRTFGDIRRTPLMTAVFAWCLFYLVASLIIVIIPEYKAPLELSDSQVSYMLGAATLGVATGGGIVGIFSGRFIVVRFIPMGAVGMTIGFFVLGILQLPYIWILVTLGLIGLAAGVYVVPILALLQHMPVPGFRARCLGTANFSCYVTMSMSAGLYGLMAIKVGSHPETWFLITGIMAAIISISLFFMMPSLSRGARPESFSTVQDREDHGTA